MLSIEKLVSPDTFTKFRIYEDLLLEWNRRTALVQEDTLQHFNNRHVLDSLQIIPVIDDFFFPSPSTIPPIPLDISLKPGVKLDNPPKKIADLLMIDVGTGAGFPGLIMAMCGFVNITLCESNHRKCVFLEEVARQTGTRVSIVNKRVEDLVDTFDIILSRACADLEALCFMMSRLSRTSSSLGIFHKGKSWESEVIEAQKKWGFVSQIYQSITSPGSIIITLRELSQNSLII